MPQLRMNYDPAKRPILDVEIGYPVGLPRPGDTPKVAMVPLLVDTGTRRTHIAKHVADSLSLMEYSQSPINFGSNSMLVDVYFGDLRFPSMNISYSGRLFPNFPNPTNDYVGVLGRDILELGSSYFDGIKKELTLTL
jgi:hypothetical protein